MAESAACIQASAEGQLPDEAGEYLANHSFARSVVAVVLFSVKYAGRAQLSVPPVSGGQIEMANLEFRSTHPNDADGFLWRWSCREHNPNCRVCRHYPKD